MTLNFFQQRLTGCKTGCSAQNRNLFYYYDLEVWRYAYPYLPDPNSKRLRKILNFGTTASLPASSPLFAEVPNFERGSTSNSLSSSKRRLFIKVCHPSVLVTKYSLDYTVVHRYKSMICHPSGYELIWLCTQTHSMFCHPVVYHWAYVTIGHRFWWQKRLMSADNK